MCPFSCRMRLILCLFAAVTALSAPSASYAQQGTPIGSGDIERTSPGRVLLQRKKELRLDNRQVAALDSLSRDFERQARVLADSIRKSQRAITTAPPMLRRPPEG